MPQYVVKFAEERYCKWSSVTDSPISYLTNTRDEAVAEFGKEDVEAADENGCSCCDNSLPGPSHVEQILSANAAGINEESIGLEEILKVWTKPNE